MEEPKTTPLFREITTNTYKLFLPTDVLQKIDFICSQLSTKEWSGTLFYTHEGSIAENNLVILVKDFLLQDIGSAGSTEFIPCEDVPAYMLEKDLLECDLGLIHSHNSMATFFSGTDINTLKAEAVDHNHFVSLIVNNAGTYTAAITSVVSSKKTIVDSYSYKTFDGEEKTGEHTYVTESQEIQWTKLLIEKETASVSPFQEVSLKIKELLEEKAKVVTPITTSPYPYPNYQTYPYQPNRVDNSPNPVIPIIPRVTTPAASQTTLFPPVSQQAELDIEEYELDYASLYAESTVNPSILEDMCKKLVSCCPILPVNNKVNVKEFVTNMPKLYSTFGGIKQYIGFIESYAEFILYNTWDNEILKDGVEELRTDEMAAVLAFHAIAYLETMGDRNKNIYLNALLESLELSIL